MFLKNSKIVCGAVFMFLINQISFHVPAYSESTLQVDSLQNSQVTLPTVALNNETTPEPGSSSLAANINLVEDNPLSPSTPDENPPSLIARAALAKVTLFPGRPVITIFTNQATVTIDQSSSSQFRMKYDISQADSFGGSIINFAQSLQGPQNLSETSQFEFGIATNTPCPAGTPCLRVDFVDNAGQIGSATIDGLSPDETTVTLTQDELKKSNPDLNFSEIRQINFLVDQKLASNPVGFYDIRAGGLEFTPIITAQAPTAAPTQMPGAPVIGNFAKQGTVTLDQTSDAQFQVNYDVTTPGSFAGAIIDYAPTTNGFEDVSGVSDFVFNLSTNNVCTDSKCLKLEFVDINDQVAFLTVNGLDASSKQISVAQNLIYEANPKFDLTHLRQINFVIEESNTRPKTGFLNVLTGGINGIPDPNPDPKPDPDPKTNPDPDPIPDLDPIRTLERNGVLFTGITEGQTVSGVVKVQPDLTTTPDIRKVAYYLNGTKAGRSYDAPFIWGGENGVDTSRLSNGAYELTAVYTTPAGDQTFTLRFNVNNVNANAPSPEPLSAPDGVFKGLTPHQIVSGNLKIQPDLQVVPDIRKVFYYIDGTRIDRVYEAPFALRGEPGFDISTLNSGSHTLSIVYATTNGDFMNSGEFAVTIPFTTT